MHKLLALLTTPVVLAALIGCAGQGDASGAYPNRPIKVVVPFAAGGGTDTFARVIKQSIEENNLLPQPLVIVNVGGAGATIGSRRVKAAEPDGYTVLLLHDAIVMAKYAGKVRYGPEAFTPVAGTSENGLVVAARAGQDAYQNLTEAVDDAISRPSEVTFGCNLATPTHFVGLLLEQDRAGLEFRFVQTGDGAQRFTALKGGHIDLTVFSSEEYLRYQPEGIQALAFFGEARHPAMPDVPTATEQGFDVQTGIMQYWWMPEDSPAESVDVFADALQQAMQTEQVREFLSKSHTAPTFLRDEALSRRIKAVDAKVAGVNLREQVDMPNLPLLTFVAAGVLGVVIAWRSARAPRKPQPAADVPTPPRYGRALICIALVAAYVGVLSVGIWGLSYGFQLATMAFVLATGWTLARGRLATMLCVIALAIILAWGLHFLFTEVFVVDLP